MNRAHVIADAVAGVLRQTKPPHQVIVVDATTPPIELPAELYDRAAAVGADLVLQSHAPSTSAQRNAGVDLVTAPVVLFLDDDVVLPDDYVETLLSRWEELGFETLGGIVGSPVIPAERRRGRASKLSRQLLMLHYHDDDADATIVRRSGKLRYVHHPDREVFIPAVATMAVAYRTDLARKHRFDEKFPGYALGEDLDMAMRLARDAPILQLPYARFRHDAQPGERNAPARWYYKGRRETYFRLRHLGRGPVSVAAFALSLAAETGAAAIDSARERDPAHVKSFVGGFVETLRDVREEGRLRGALTLKPRPYYVATRAFQKARISNARMRRRNGTWEGIRILGYHRVVAENDVLAVSPDDFRAHLELLLDRGVTPVRLDRALELLAADVEGQYFCVTFDDGYRDNLETALPILRDLDVPATVFVVSGIASGDLTFEWYRDPPPALSWRDVAELIAGGLVDVQAHTRTHRALPRLDDGAAHDEIAGCKRDIEEHVPYTVTSICYPGGLYGERDVQLMREAGYRAGVTTAPGVNRRGADLSALFRTMIYWRDSVADFDAKVSGLLDEPSPIQAWLQERRRRPVRTGS